MTETVLFYVAGAAALVTALMVVLSRSPLYSALSLILSLCSVSVLYLLLEAPFVAAMQVLVYAGAIMVLFVFVIMLLNLQPGMSGRPAYLSMSKALGAMAALYLFVRILLGATVEKASAGALEGTVKNVGTLLLTDYLFAFEAISILLLVAVVGAVVLGLKRLT